MFRRMAGMCRPGLIPVHTGRRGQDSVELIELAISDFEGDDYSIGGVEKTFTDLWRNATAGLTVVSDEGLVFERTFGGTSSSASASSYATDDLNAALTPELGFTAVIDVTIIGDNSSSFVFALVGADFPLSTSPLSAACSIDHGIAFKDHDSNYTQASPGGVGSHRLAVSFDPAGMSYLSGDGSSVASHDSFIPDNTGGKPPYLYAYLGQFGAPGECGVIFEKITFYNLQPATALPALSTLS